MNFQYNQQVDPRGPAVSEKQSNSEKRVYNVDLTSDDENSDRQADKINNNEYRNECG